MSSGPRVVGSSGRRVFGSSGLRVVGAPSMRGQCVRWSWRRRESVRYRRPCRARPNWTDCFCASSSIASSMIFVRRWRTKTPGCRTRRSSAICVLPRSSQRGLPETLHEPGGEARAAHATARSIVLPRTERQRHRHLADLPRCSQTFAMISSAYQLSAAIFCSSVWESSFSLYTSRKPTIQSVTPMSSSFLTPSTV